MDFAVYYQLVRPRYMLLVCNFKQLFRNCNETCKLFAPLGSTCKSVTAKKENPRQISYCQVYLQPCLLAQKNISIYISTSQFHTSCMKSSRTSSDDSKKVSEDESPPQKLSLFQKFKQMYRDYWYVLVPVHIVTSIFWFGGFYYMAQSGIDIVAFLESLGISEKFINPLRDSKAGYIAISYALYKIATPVRYTVTLGGTTISINYLKNWGYIKPMPSKEKLKEIYEEKKEELKQKKDQFMGKDQ